MIHNEPSLLIVNKLRINHFLRGKEQKNQIETKVNGNNKAEKDKEVHVLIENSRANISERRNFRSAVDLPTYLKDNEKV